ncbi:MAG TPA: hypothetical protein PKY82_11610, partial [Pyrinomonadaceae bacterium]|nr:hypothetical protein [Pyrinomonadaceae bacterium]
MKQRIFFAILLLLLFFEGLFAKEKPTQVFYEISPFVQNNEAKLKISLSFQGGKTGETMIKLPLEFGGQEQLYKCVRNLRVTTPNAKLSETDKPEIKKITHSPNEKITLEYELVQDWEGNPNSGGASQNAGGGYRPIIKSDYFHVLGNGAWILPDLKEDAKLTVSIVWSNFPKEWKWANSFGANQTKQTFQTDSGSFLSSVFVGGDFRVNQKLVNGKPIVVALRGKWNFTDDEFTNLVQKVIEVERKFWNDFNHPYYLVTAIPLEGKNSYSFGGTGLTDSFATFMTTNAKLDNISSLLSHEYFHNWNTIAFGGMKEPEALLYWFSEGFTDYYAYRLLFRAGLIDAERYLAQYNEFLTDYYLSDVRNEGNQRVLADFFKDYGVGKLPYRRGFLLATKWNQIIMQQSNGKKSLDDVMKDIFRDAKKGKIKQISKEYLLNLFAKYANYNFATDIEKYVENGETIGDFNGVFGNCVENFEVKKGKFELGFDFEKSRTAKIISELISNSAAFEAGL